MGVADEHVGASPAGNGHEAGGGVAGSLERQRGWRDDEALG